MKRRLMSAGLILALLLALCAPVALADSQASARTTLEGASDNKLNNIYLAVDAISGTRVRYGQSFSFNEVVGPRTQARGYRSAVNGRGVNVTGGGVAQVATTLYMALLSIDSGIQFDELATYGSRFRDSYVGDGDLAVITDYSADTDFRFTNYASDMTISLWSDGRWLRCEIALEDGSQGGGWFDGWITPAPTANPRTQTITARIPFDPSVDTAENIRLAADSVTDTVLANGGDFSFNEIVGPRTREYGYGSGTNGRGVRVTGGGVAQVASVIWMAVKDMDDIAILEKTTYGDRYNQSYVSSSADAIVTDYGADTDFSFRYTGPGTITIYTYIDGRSLVCDVVRNG